MSEGVVEEVVEENKPPEFTVGAKSPYAVAVNGETVTVITEEAIRALNANEYVESTAAALTTSVLKIITEEPRPVELSSDDVNRLEEVLEELVAKVSG